MKNAVVLASLLISFATVGCSNQQVICYGENHPTQAQAYEATIKAFQDCGLEAIGNKEEMRIESDWNWGGVGGASGTLLFPLMWAKYSAIIHEDTLELEGHAYGWGIWLGAFQNLPVSFPIWPVEGKIIDRLKEIPADKSKGS